MKLKSLTVAIAIATISLPTLAAEKDGVYIGVFGNYYDASWKDIENQGDLEVNEAKGFGAELGYRFNNSWSARLEYTDMGFDVPNIVTGERDTGERYGADVLYHFDSGEFYSLVGVKEIDLANRNTFVNLGFGSQGFISDGFFINAEIAAYQGLDQHFTDVGFKLGINYLFGQDSTPAQALQPAPTFVEESTMDEPNNEKRVSEEPEKLETLTPETMIVDNNVELIDSDGDGVIDVDDNCPNTPIIYAIDMDGCTLYNEKEVMVSLSVHFPNNDSGVSKQYLEDINSVAVFLKEYPRATVLLEGHTSSIGEAKYNVWLSKRRADKVGKALIADGISAKRITTKGIGEARLKNKADTPEAHIENRRVEAHIKTIKSIKVLR